MRWFFYNLLFSVGYLAMMPRFLYRMWRRGGYRHAFAQRLGRYDAATRARLRERPRVWIHGVSVGEIAVAARFMRTWRRHDPEIAFVLSTTTSTGYRQAAAALAPEDVLIYFPLDYPGIVRRVLRQMHPRALILVESELWPNLARRCRAQGIPLFLVNGRISDKSFPGYRRLRFFFGPVLRGFDRILAQTEQDARRLKAMGAPEAIVRVAGTFKYDAASRDPVREKKAAAELERLFPASSRGRVLMGGSTWPGEERLLLAAYVALKKETPSLRLVLAPRHAERAEQAVQAIRRAGLEPVRLSALRREGGGEAGAPGRSASDRVLLLDTTGDLMSFYALADIVFVGKSLTAGGGQNMIEPALCGKAVVVGPRTENFRPVMDDLLADRAILQISGPGELREGLAGLIRDEAERNALGRRAARAVESRRGAVERSVEQVRECLASRTGDASTG